MIKKAIFTTFKKVFTLSEKKNYFLFKEALDNPRDSQDSTLKKILQRLEGSRYAQKLGVIRNYSDYTQKVPIINYDDIGPLVMRMLEGERNILFNGDIKIFEKTSGSGQKEKYIPYPDELIADFTAMFRLWAYDLLEYGPRFKTGTFYFSVSPQFNEREVSASGAKINLENDEEYLQGWTRTLLKPFIAVDPRIKKIQDPEKFKKTLREQLINSRDLEVISVWNPSFLTGLFDESVSREEIQSFFPSLKLISCWGSSLARYDFNYLKETFPDVLVQEKGLLATEAPVTIPLLDAPAPVPLSHLVFLEFRNSQGEILRLHELEKSQEYELIVSQRGGLYRYELGDCVRVVDFYRQTPCFEFIGRTDRTCDLVGEKISEDFIEAFFNQSSSREVAVVIPSKKRKQYLLLSPVRGSHKDLEKHLMSSYHYRNARKLGQLKHVARIQAENFPKTTQEMLLDFFEGQRQMLRGDIKFRRLYSREWNDELLNWLLENGGTSLKEESDLS